MALTRSPSPSSSLNEEVTDTEPLRRPGTLTPDELASLDGHDAFSVNAVSKRFVKSGRPRWLTRGAKKRNSVKMVRAVDDVTLTIHRREIFGVLGSNGSGKSTLIRLISTLLLPDEGKIEVFGHDVEREARMVQRLINRVSVEAAFFRKLSPMENLLYSARLYGLTARQARPMIVEILTRLGIKRDRIAQPLENMSRGMQQKVAIARAFLTAPILLLLDEPTTGLDPRSKQDVQVFIRELRDTHDATILLTTHDMDEADALCDQIAVIDGGRLVAQGTPEQLKLDVAARMGLDHPATLTEVFLAHTGRDWEEDEADDEEDDDDETNEIDETAEIDANEAHGVQEGK
ncbi:MAG TPA: ABC transporter ATP-binding protein [Ktedonobacterales bacterium]|nr:ABC transporter ATP-binding protein [Ktedonobacterales bacterium]